MRTVVSVLSVYISPNVGWSELPLLSDAEGVGVDALGNVDAVGQLVDVLERSLDAVEDGAENAGSQLHRQRLSGSQDRVADGNARSILVDLRVGVVKRLFFVADKVYTGKYNIKEH